MPKWDIWLCENCGKVFHTHLSANSQCPQCGAYEIVAADYKAVPLREKGFCGEQLGKEFTQESASQKRGFEDSTLILREEMDTEKMSAKEMEEELHERRKEIYAKMEKERAELEQEIALNDHINEIVKIIEKVGTQGGGGSTNSKKYPYYSFDVRDGNIKLVFSKDLI